MNLTRKILCASLKCPTMRLSVLQKTKLLQIADSDKGFIFVRTVLARPKEMDDLRALTKKKIEKGTYDEDDQCYMGGFSMMLLCIPVISFGLGTWQIFRRQWKLDLINQLNERLSREPIELPENLQDLNDLEYCPVKVRGKFLHEREFLVGPRSLIINGQGANEGKGTLISSGSKNKGYYIITPLKLEDRDETILVNRGWIPHDYKHPSFLKKCETFGTQEVTGVVRLNETRPQFVLKNEPEKGIWNYRDLYQMAEYAGTDPIFIDALKKPNSGKSLPWASQTRVTLKNDHLSYIITWYGIASLTGYYWFRIFIQKRPIF